MESYVEHTNISVTDVDKSIRFFSTAMPDLRVRHDSGPGPKRWVHLGTDVTYISINQMPPPAEGEFECHRPGYNHIGFVVSDADVLRERMLEAGYQEGFVPEPHPHRKRVYFIDNDGMQYEFVQYYSDDVAEKNDYEL
ncbi:MAG: VOC family protein [Lentisphaerae bacterium]|jgi:catechol 2,3-dioxygenase-like lactoylglutathione lyase family enzyme|nr:VOC family protein [Lentisphaerota bacterium]MBT4815596.1 VOC family protein [Lentisphaerota bacterium]MBT5605542.1 VOC family protein [Lentisphaerota bacterium]MBT7056819.1 VOC family protein [Lentisphaerota bacterium]MBT7845395.1 VOC family protein [Lentisphaerota bacterium]